MTILERIYREPAALLGFVTAALGILLLLSVLSPELAGGIVTLVGALVALLRYVVTPSAEVIAQHRPDGIVVLGDAYDGETVTVDFDTTGNRAARRRDNRGATDLSGVLVLAILVVLLVAIIERLL